MPYFPPSRTVLAMPSHIPNEDEHTATELQSEPTNRPLQPANPPATVRIKNRRNRYLDTHPEYFSPTLELAGLPRFRQVQKTERA